MRANPQWHPPFIRRRNPAVGSPPRDEITRETFRAVFHDSDGDGIPDVDDAHPWTPSNQRIEEGSLASEIGNLIDIRADFVDAKNEVMDRLQSLGIHDAKVKGRVKAPVSVINKLIRKRLSTLTDMAGTMIVVPDLADLDAVVGQIRGGLLGTVVEEEDHYEIGRRTGRPYKAVHFLVEIGQSADGRPLVVEVQAKTARQAAIAGAAHEAYKAVRPGSREEREFFARMGALTAIADAADRGDLRASADIDTRLASPARLERWIAHGE